MEIIVDPEKHKQWVDEVFDLDLFQELKTCAVKRRDKRDDDDD